MDFLQWLILLFLALAAIAGFGFDPKKWWWWIPIISSFILGVLVSFLKKDSLNLGGGICLGLVIALFTVLYGNMMRRRKLKADEDFKRIFKESEK